MAEKTVYALAADGGVRNRNDDYATCHDAATGDTVYPTGLNYPCRNLGIVGQSPSPSNMVFYRYYSLYESPLYRFAASDSALVI